MSFKLDFPSQELEPKVTPASQNVGNMNLTGSFDFNELVSQLSSFPFLTEMSLGDEKTLFSASQALILKIFRV